MRVMICGGSGFIGTALARAMQAREDEVWIVTRQLPAAPAAGFHYVTWDEWSRSPDRWSGIDAIVNLSGESINQKWTEDAKRRILISRTQAAMRIADITRRMSDPPQVLVNASGISLYGHSWSVKQKRSEKKRSGAVDNGSAPLAADADASDVSTDMQSLGIRGFSDRFANRRQDESSDVEGVPANDFEDLSGSAGHSDITFDESSPARPADYLGRVVVAWEEAADQVPVERIVKLRIGLVLGRKGGAFPLLRMAHRLFVGGNLGSGSQGMPWIHLQDMISLIIFCLDNPDISGPVNGVGPEPLDNETFGRTLGQVTKRPHWLNVPGKWIRLALGEMSGLLLTGQKAYPRKALEHGFKFAFPRLEDALRDLTR